MPEKVLTLKQIINYGGLIPKLHKRISIPLTNPVNFENKEVPSTDYYVKWIRKTRKEFPDIKIVAGSWLSHLDEIHLLLKAGADSITKFPSIRKFNTKYAKKIEDEAKKAKRNKISFNRNQEAQRSRSDMERSC